MRFLTLMTVMIVAGSHSAYADQKGELAISMGYNVVPHEALYSNEVIQQVLELDAYGLSFELGGEFHGWAEHSIEIADSAAAAAALLQGWGVKREIMSKTHMFDLYQGRL